MNDNAQITLSEKELEKYLSYVPYNYIDEGVYSREKTDINTVNKRLLLGKALGQNEKNFNIDDNQEYYFINEEKINNTLKDIYNIELTSFSLKSNADDQLTILKNIKLILKN